MTASGSGQAQGKEMGKTRLDPKVGREIEGPEVSESPPNPFRKLHSVNHPRSKRRPRRPCFYSCLSAAIGSIRLALRAGIQQASVATPNRIAGTPTKTGRLTGPFVIARTEITRASTHPIAAPQVIPLKFSRIICRTTRPLVAPNARRTPISLVRLATPYETTA